MGSIRSSTIIFILYITILSTGFVCNIFLGVITFNQDTAKEYFHLDQVKFLRVLTLLGNALGALLSLALFRRLQPKNILSLSLTLESALLALSAFLRLSYPVVIISCLLIGLCQGLRLVYFPLWIDRNAPLKYQSLMLSLWYTIHACGVSLGGSLNISRDGMFIVLLATFCLVLVPCSLSILLID